MTIRDREVLEELRDDPELLALADAVVETQRLRRRTPIGALTAVAVAAAALFALVLASPWDRGGGERASVLDRALAAIETQGRVVHMTIRFEESGGRRFSPVITESFYDGQTGLVRVISRSDGETLADYTTKASEDEFVMFPGLLEGADYYREALSSGRAKVIGSGVWRGRPVHWVRLEGRGGPGILEIGIARESAQPVVFRSLNPDGTPSGFQAAVIGFEYVRPAAAAFQPAAPVLVRGLVLGQDCYPTRARVGAYRASTRPFDQASAEIASARSGPDGLFVLRVDPAKSPFRKDGRFNFTLHAQVPDPTTGFAFVPFSRVAKDGKWLAAEPLIVRVAKDPAPECD
jgi:hypothetical protein